MIVQSTEDIISFVGIMFMVHYSSVWGAYELKGDTEGVKMPKEFNNENE
jgi:hypothetical protein